MIPFTLLLICYSQVLRAEFITYLIKWIQSCINYLMLLVIVITIIIFRIASHTFKKMVFRSILPCQGLCKDRLLYCCKIDDKITQATPKATLASEQHIIVYNAFKNVLRNIL